MRKLASIQQVAEIRSIPGADRICQYRINGWWVIDQVGKYTVGDYIIYCEIDSWIPTELAAFLSKGKEPREFEGIKGERLKTIRLKGQLSQGLLLPLHLIEEKFSNMPWVEGSDITDELGIVKWERPIPAQLAGMMKGNFPSFIPKTSQERVQNIRLETMADIEFEATEKLHGCVKGTTLLEVKGKGQVQISQVQVGDYILGYDHDTKTSVWTEVVGTQATKSPQKEWYTLTTSSKTLTLTGNHKIFVVELNKYIAIEELVKLPNYLDYTLLTF